MTNILPLPSAQSCVAPVRIRAVAPAELAYHWRRVEPLIQKALDSHGVIGRHQPIDILVACGQDRMQPWFCEDGTEIIAVMLTAEVQFPRRKACQILLVSGERMDDWLDLWTHTIEAHARARGCDHLEAQARPGWARVTGANVAAVMIVKDL